MLKALDFLFYRVNYSIKQLAINRYTESEFLQLKTALGSLHVLSVCLIACACLGGVRVCVCACFLIICMDLMLLYEIRKTSFSEFNLKSKTNIFFLPGISSVFMG